MTRKRPDDTEVLESLNAMAAEERAEREKRGRVIAEQRYQDARRRLLEFDTQERVLEELDRRRISGHSRRKSKLETGNSTAVLCCTDWHAEENVDPATINGKNEFNLEVCAARIGRVWDKTVELICALRSFTKIQNLVLWLGGDLINGYIHEELEESNFLGPAEAIDFVEGHLCDGIATLRKHLKMPITVLGNWGNHGRSTKKRRVSTGAASSWEYLCYRHLQRVHQSQPGVDVLSTKGYHWLWDVQGHRVRFHHGDNIRYQGGVGGITIPVNKAIAQWNKANAVACDIFGHWHQYMEDWRFVSCGCLVGYNAYAESIKADCQDPSQTLVVFSAHRGKCMALPIYVEPSKK